MTPMAKPRISLTGHSDGVLLWRPEAQLVDEMVDCHAEWRGCATAVANAYWRWSESPPNEAHRRYSAYNASLDQEQAAAAGYERAVAQVEHWLERAHR